MKSHRPALRVKARQMPENTHSKSSSWFLLAAAAVLLAVLIFNASSARAQFPRIGISGSPTEYLSEIDVVLNEEFTLYVCAFGPDEETPLNQEFSSLSWVMHQVCCGASLTVHSVEYSPYFQHVGTPNTGVISSSEVCVDEPSILLATMAMTINADEDGAYLAASGPYHQAVDCEGENPMVMAMTMTLNLTGVSSTPTDSAGLDEIKALYR